ncbi:DMT family transporter [Pseudomonas sp. DTU_2021_1001937_2_SI_NGA_ILE_001]|uniref:DMT family transporter n=1 Tax=Pseudomonas sp. DTU_2021_1001937_2_SI_NGA_ILE_001 TaxID=3077589 RepID=UPI0025EA2F4A|nr:DMT family transporter [Pseudomonas sp. DTU_2021_1001937_2_SI_NGA_ILE_001]WNW13221.1 DMT family transporter [Pseudomonas sp. DTU_2021_1001937_2_SI_NGA_ILE_001]
MIASSNVAQPACASVHRNALVSAHVAAILFGLTGILGALIQADSSIITFARAAFAVLALGAFAQLQGRPVFRGLDGRRLAVLVASGVFLTSHWISFFIAVKVGGVAVATLGFASFPAFIALIDRLVFRERIAFGEALLVAMVTFGLVLVVPSFDFANQGTKGLLWGLASGFSFAVLAVINRRYIKGLDSMQVAFWQNLTVSLLVAPFVVNSLGQHVLSTLDWIYLAVLGVLCTGLSQYLFVRSLKVLDARSAGLIIALEPVYAIACAWALFSEEPSLRMLLGAAIIIFATVISARGKKAVEASTH